MGDTYPLTLAEVMAMSTSHSDPIKDFYDSACAVNSPESGLGGPPAQ